MTQDIQCNNLDEFFIEVTKAVRDNGRPPEIPTELDTRSLRAVFTFHDRKIDEPVSCYMVEKVLRGEYSTMANLFWLIPMALNDIRGTDNCVLFSITEEVRL
jgi:hypothetical protein